MIAVKTGKGKELESLKNLIPDQVSVRYSINPENYFPIVYNLFLVKIVLALRNFLDHLQSMIRLQRVFEFPSFFVIS